MVPLAQALLMLAAIFAFLSLGLFLARRWRDRADDDRPVPENLLSKFREMHGRGELSDEEFRTIKTKLASQFQQEVRDTEETG